MERCVKACSRTCVCSRRLAAAWHSDPQCNVCDWLGGIGERVVPHLARALDTMSLDAGGPVTDRLLDTAPLRQSVLSALAHSTAPAPTWGTCIDHSLLRLETQAYSLPPMCVSVPPLTRQAKIHTPLPSSADNNNNSNNSHLGQHQGPSGDSGSRDCPPLAWKADATGS